MKTKKEASKASGIGALIGFILGLISTVLFFVLGFSTLLGIGSYIENEGIETQTKVEETIEETKTTGPSVFDTDYRDICKTWKDCTNPCYDCINCPLRYRYEKYNTCYTTTPTFEIKTNFTETKMTND